MILIKNAYIKTMVGDDIPNGQILIDNGKIKAISSENITYNPTITRVIDVSGNLLTPGFIDGHTHIGVWQEGVGFEGRDVNETSDPLMPELRVIDSIAPDTIGFKEAIKAGITTAAIGPGSCNVLNGQFLVAKLHGNRIDDMVIKDPVAMKAALGENPKMCYGKGNKPPVTRMGAAALLRKTLYEAIDYMKDKESGNEYTKNAKLESLIPVLKGSIAMKIHAHQTDDIFTAIRIGKEFGITITIEHCTAGWRIADQIASDNVMCFTGPIMLFRDKYEGRDLSFKTPVALHKAGVKIAIVTDAPITPLEYLPLTAGLCIKAGLPEDAAWKAITINPAEMLGVSEKIGSIEVGKDADLVVFDKNPLRDLDCRTIFTMINGKIVYQNIIK